MASLWGIARSIFTSNEDREAYRDDNGRPRTAGGFLIGQVPGEPYVPRDFTRQPGWQLRNASWWAAYGLVAGEVYDCDRAGSLETYGDKYSDPRYTQFAGEPVPDYVGPYFSRNAVRYFAKRRINVPEWAQMEAGKHSDPRIHYAGWEGTPEGYGGTYSWKKGYKPSKRSA